MSGAEEELERVREAVLGLEESKLQASVVEAMLIDVHIACERKASARAALLGANDYESQLVRLAEYHLASDEHTRVLNVLASAVDRPLEVSIDETGGSRRLISQTLDRSGAPEIVAGRYRVTPLDPVASAKVDEPDKLPLDYWRSKVEPDMAKVSAALRSGQDVPGARLEQGPPRIQIRAKESR